MRRERSVYRIFAMPLVFFVTGMFGLISALLFDNPVDLLASLVVGMPVMTVACIVHFRTRKNIHKHKRDRYQSH
ncbi:hypothetical protein FKG94_11945 [Exilibacterium tricleocarpae]|uniref:Uncharacterized protein n=1 Tax=Exilibacterium tricleocarpae TaxID=2591008 RepID=A0A545TNC5_9GAMM|nr:hypothetical protein FKG94_11945 [Exilibacterium tricleocarpae]